MLWRLLDICLLRAGPQDLPASRRFLTLTLAGYVVVNVLVSRLSLGLREAAVVSLLDTLLLAAFAQVVLRVAARPERFLQTLAALAGTGQLLGLLALPLVAGLLKAQAAGQAAAGLALIWLGVLIWSLLVLGHILRHALAVRFVTGVGIGVLYNLVSIMIMRSVFPGGG